MKSSILARNFSLDWMGDVTERFYVGEQLFVRISSINANFLADISVKADLKNVDGNISKDNHQIDFESY